jgi:uncharacterized protein (DUF1697 family)
MDTKIIKLGICTLIMLAKPMAQAQLSMGEDLNLDFTKELESIQKVNTSAEPMQKHLEKGLTDLRKLISEVKANPNPLTKAKFEVQFAKHIDTLVTDMDDILANRQEIQWALTDIGDKLRSTTKRLKYNYDKMDETVSRAKEKMEFAKAKLLKIAKDLKRSGGKDPKIIREFKNLERAYKFTKRNYETHDKIRKMLSKTLTALGNNGYRFTQSTEGIDDWFANLKAQRDSFLKLAEARNDIQKLNQLMTQGGATSVLATFKKLGSINKQMDKFLDTFDEMSNDLDALNSFDANYDNSSNTASSGLTDDEAVMQRVDALLNED